MHRCFQQLIVSVCVASFGGPLAIADTDVRFSRDILPLLSDRCFHCHGPDESHREAELRLDEYAGATADRGGYAAVAPGDPDNSEIWQRISSDDPDLVMPPPDSHRKPLTDAEQAAIRRWISDGAQWGQHWSFERPVRPQLPTAHGHPIDALVHRRLEQSELTPSPPAPRHTLLRRVSFDLTGLPPTREQVQAYVNDESPAAFEAVVDQLLESPRYGERMAMWWLDLARYADTDGYQQDATRNNWPWRDWVIDSFNSNKTFDQFTIEQFAGDLLPDASPEQILATCFHRNHMTNGEGGRDPEESRIDYVIDRVNTTGTVWLGLTLGCCQCHSHKFDPITQRDYYSFSAFFDSIDEDGKAGGGAKPWLEYRSPFVDRAVREAEDVVAQRRTIVDAVQQDALAAFEPWLEEMLQTVDDGFQPWRPLQLTSVQSVEGTLLNVEADSVIQAAGPMPRQDDYRIAGVTDLKRITGIRLEVLPHASHTQGRLSRGDSGVFILTDVKLQVRRRGQSQLRDLELDTAVADVERNVKGRNYGRIADTLDDDPRNGWTIDPEAASKPHVAVFALQQPLQLQDDEEAVFVLLHRSTGGHANIGRFRISVTDQPGAAVRSLNAMPLEALAASGVTDVQQITAPLRERLLQQFLQDHADYQTVQASLKAAERQLGEFRKAQGQLKVMVLAERTSPRTTSVLQRGVWDAKGEQVSRGVPDAIMNWPSERLQTRLDLAEWLVDRNNPLTARVVVNQLWQLCFGAGLVRTPEDFGLQGELPTHPDLLDWLAVEFMESGWDIKHVMKLIVTSNTYQQSSHLTAQHLELDPDNRLLARGARFRLPSWMIRDAALQSSGLLNDALGGPPVRPYQPAGVWEEMFMGRFRYEPSQGPAQHRRSLYAFWRRSAAPTFLFDSAQRRVCEVRPHQTNTPLHALTLMNDQTILESARSLAQTVVQDIAGPEERVNVLFESILSRPASAAEQRLLGQQLGDADSFYQQNPDEAARLLDFGQPERRPRSHQPEIAAAMLIASLIYNLDEAITHE